MDAIGNAPPQFAPHCLAKRGLRQHDYPVRLGGLGHVLSPPLPPNCRLRLLILLQLQEDARVAALHEEEGRPARLDGVERGRPLRLPKRPRRG